MIPQITPRHSEMVGFCIERLATLPENPPYAQDLFCRTVNPILSEVFRVGEQNLLTVNYGQSPAATLGEFIRNSFEQFPLLEQIVPQFKKYTEIKNLPAASLQRNPQNPQSAPSLVPVIPIPPQAAPVAHSSVVASSASNKPTATAISYTNILHRISWFFRNGQEKEALEEFELLPEDLKTEAYFAHYIACNKPTGYAGDFGKDSLLGRAGDWNSALPVRACAIELCRPLFVLKEILSLLENHELEKAQRLFHTLPIGIQREILGCYWNACQKPMGYQGDFARDSFLSFNREQVAAFLQSQPNHCTTPEKRAESMRSYLAVFEFRKRLEKLCTRTQEEINNWKAIDQTPSNILRGQEKNMKKKGSFASFAEEILLDTGHMATEITALKTNKDEDGPATLMGIYLNKYPSLRPFCLLLRPDFRFEDKLPEHITSGK